MLSKDARQLLKGPNLAQATWQQYGSLVITLRQVSPVAQADLLFPR